MLLSKGHYSRLWKPQWKGGLLTGWEEEDALRSEHGSPLSTAASSAQQVQRCHSRRRLLEPRSPASRTNHGHQRPGMAKPSWCPDPNCVPPIPNPLRVKGQPLLSSTALWRTTVYYNDNCNKYICSNKHKYNENDNSPICGDSWK